MMGNDIKRPLIEIFVISLFFYCFSQKELSELREHLTGEKVSTVIVRSSHASSEKTQISKQFVLF